MDWNRGGRYKAFYKANDSCSFFKTNASTIGTTVRIKVGNICNEDIIKIFNNLAFNE